MTTRMIGTISRIAKLEEKTDPDNTTWRSLSSAEVTALRQELRSLKLEAIANRLYELSSMLYAKLPYGNESLDSKARVVMSDARAVLSRETNTTF